MSHVIRLKDEHGNWIPVPTIKGEPGDAGRGIVSIIRTSGTGAPGTVDTYTITYSDDTTSTYQIRNGADGSGAGDMTKSVYDSNNNGVVDNAEKLGGQLPDYYAKTSDIPVNLSDLSGDSMHRTVTDTEKAGWNEKQDAIGYTPVPDTRKINGKELSADFSLNAVDVGAAASSDVTALQQMQTVHITAGTAPAFTVADASVASYAAGLRRTVKFHAAGTNATINFNGKGAKAVYEYTGKQLSPKAGQVIEVAYDGTNFFAVSVGGGGVEFPATISAGTVPIYVDIATTCGGENGVAVVVPNSKFTAKRACTLRISYEVRGSTMGSTWAALFKNAGSQIPGTDVSLPQHADDWTFKTVDVTFAANDVFWLQIHGSGSYGSMCARCFIIQITAPELQGEIDNLILPTS